MSTFRILVTGGAGFIGSHLIDELLLKGHSIRVLDNLESQVHGEIQQPPDYLSSKIEFIKGDIRNTSILKNTIEDIDVIYHLGAMVGVGQSMYQISKYNDVNINGTANLLDLLVNSNHNVKKLVVASSNTIYGEGSYKCNECGIVYPKQRSKEQLEKRIWEVQCPNCNKTLVPIPTKENKPDNCTSIYALTKLEQEKQSIMIGKTYGIDTTALRFFLVYGSRQSLSNPYTGVCSIFSSALLNGNPPTIYEDGNQSRDFVHVKDICQALILSMEKKNAKNEVFNVGTGQKITINHVAETLTNYINPKIKPIIANKYRLGDIRHCYPDISKIMEKIGYSPKLTFDEGIKEVIEWVKSQTISKDKSDDMNQDLKKKGLIL